MDKPIEFSRHFVLIFPTVFTLELLDIRKEDELSIVKPFRGLRPKPEFAQEIASPPYDVLSTQEAREIAKNNPNSFLRVNKAELEFDDNVNPYSERVYQRGKDNLTKLVNNGLMIRDSKPCFYLYRLTMNEQSQTGLVALTSVDEYDAGLIKKHEHTRPAKVNDRANHIEFLEAQVGPVFSTFRYDEMIDKIFQKITMNTPAPSKRGHASPPDYRDGAGWQAGSPISDFVADDGVRHEFWVVEDENLIQEIVNEFARLPHLYIADGHHRSQSASEVCRRFREKYPDFTGDEPFNYFLNVTFPDSELNILAYNRVVKDLNELSLSELLQKVSETFVVEPRENEIMPTEPHTFGMYCEGKWFLLISREGTFEPNDPTGSIDAAILGKNLIAPILGISDPKTDKRINFVGGIRGTRELVILLDSGEYKLAFSLYPTSIQQLLNVADAGKVMPPKSTWFEPKLRSGMIINMLTN